MISRVVLLEERKDLDYNTVQNMIDGKTKLNRMSVPPVLLRQIVEKYEVKLLQCGIEVSVSKNPSRLDFQASPSTNFTNRQLTERVNTFFEKPRTIHVGREDYKISLHQ